MVARGIDKNRKAFDAIENQAKQIESQYSDLKSNVKRTTGIALVVIALLVTVGVAGGVGVLTGLPMVSDLAGFVLLGASGAGGVAAAGGTLLLEQSHLSKLRGDQKDALGTEIGYLELAQAMSVDAVTTDVVSKKIAEYSAKEFGEFFAIINQAVEEEGISDHDAKFVDAFAQNAAKFTDEQIQNMNSEFAGRIHASALRPQEEGRFGMAKVFFDMNREVEAGTLTAAGIAGVLEGTDSLEGFAEFVQFLDRGWGLPPQAFIDALSMKGEQFTDELVAQTSEELCGAIAQSASISAEQKVRFSLWRTLAEMREKMNPEQVLERIEGYSQPEFDAFVDYICAIIVNDQTSTDVPPKVMNALTEPGNVEKWIGLLAIPNTPALVNQLRNGQVLREPLLNELLRSPTNFQRDLVMGLYGKLSIADQERVNGQLRNGEQESFMLSHLQYLSIQMTIANATGRFDENLLKSAVVRHVLDANYAIRAGTANFQKLMRGKGGSEAHFGDLSPGFIIKLLELSVAISNSTQEERERVYPGFKNLRETFPNELIATLSNEQLQLLYGMASSYVAAGRSGKRVVSSNLEVLCGLLSEKMPRPAGIPNGVEVL